MEIEVVEIKRVGQGFIWLLTKPLDSTLLPDLARRSEMAAWFSLMGSIVAAASVILFPFDESALILKLARLLGIFGSLGAYYLSRRGKPSLATWILILVSIQIPAYVAALPGSEYEAIIYIHLATVLAYSTLPLKQASFAATGGFLLIGSTVLFGADKATNYADIILSLSLFVALHVSGRVREQQLGRIETQASRLVLYEKNRQEMVRHQQQADFLKQVVTNLGHDIKTPLSIINLQAHIIENMLADDKIVARVEKISGAVGQIDAVIENLRQLNKASDSIEMPMEPLDLNELLKVSQNSWCQGTRNQVELLLSNGQLMVEGNRDALQLAISMLIDNAFVHSKADVSVTLATGMRDNCVIFSITDTGPGISKHEQLAIFDIFYKVDKARTATESGPGLGLPIAKQIVENHSGQIKIYSDLGRGTQITVHMPHASQLLAVN